ncbi:ribose transport system substrate-binding protein [Streptohalobacillus salinus]|uniref:Ribose transport system substrate-binding protein n=1 Tax=Streptohalobacillus salinus TaxID=621096 RepID=A0A2V3WKH5_9BACI|nr:substrate-binding domain-containing protein [Streptohalobacillus salinus]PXW93178.1 ribose transport system substrate-binding protein [Streptohalobacillus salinus]
MRKNVTALFIIGFLVILFFTVRAFVDVVKGDWQAPTQVYVEDDDTRLVLITQQINTPFFDAVARGAIEQAEMEGASLEIVGDYSQNEEAFLNHLELAIHAKVDGIIVQGKDTDRFKELTKIKAAFYSIPVITIAEDVPMEESLRRTYVGSDQEEAGRMLANALVSQVDATGSVILLMDQSHPYIQTERLIGIDSVFNKYASLDVVMVESDTSREQIKEATQRLLNLYPDVEAILPLDAAFTEPMIDEITSRMRLSDVRIYSFDDAPDIYPLFNAGKIEALIQQTPEDMGRLSVELVFKWLNGETLPLDFDGYHTPISLIKRADTDAHD